MPILPLKISFARVKEEMMVNDIYMYKYTLTDHWGHHYVCIEKDMIMAT